ncbi:MAG TPA: DUF2189 domain-containing protein [Geminicoccaceae bacterium]|jgi:uncharacterized membrane protein|nr:DUF2189 domain-containing protein [Geminicoccaceae bacterium]
MASSDHIRNPAEWGVDQLRTANQAVERAGHALRSPTRDAPLPTIRRIEMADLKDVLAEGISDFAAYRTDVMFLCVVYPVAGLLLAWLAFGYDLLQLVLPVASGFALIGPVAAVGLYEISRRREQGVDITWADAFRVVRAPAFGAILVLGLALLAILLLWLAAAQAIYLMTLGPEPPASVGAFARDVFTTPAGWAMIVVGMAVGFLFALLVLTISVVSFPLLLDRDVGLYAAVATSVRAVATNPGSMAVWGLIVASALAVGSIPLLLGLIVIMPVLGHATWHLYRKVVA